VDIGSATVKLVELTSRRDGCRLESFAVEPLPAGSVVSGDVTDPEVVGEAIHRAHRRAGTKARVATVGVANAAVITRTIDMDASLGDDDLEGAVVQEAERHLPFPIEQVALDFEPLHLSARDPSKVEVLLAACRLEHLEHRRQAAEAGGLVVGVADIESFATQRAVAHLATDDRPLALADVGAATTTLLLVGGEATGILREEPSDFREPPPGSRGRQVVIEHAPRLLSRLLRLALMAGSIKRVDRVLLAGGPASTPGLAGRASEELGVAVGIANPFEDAEVASRIDASALAAHGPALVAACGLARRGLVEAVR